MITLAVKRKSILLLWLSCFCCLWTTRTILALTTTTATTPTTRRRQHDAPFEVIGQGGRMASIFLRLDHGIAVPRGCPPQTTAGAPIVVATPSRAWPEIRRLATTRQRRSDLVYVGNGLPLPEQEEEEEEEEEEGTWVVPHFGVLQVNGPIVSSSPSPPTFVYGRHAQFIQGVLEPHGVKVQQVDSMAALRVHAVRKLLWASCMWLLCHNHEPPRTVAQVHTTESSARTLQALVQELWPAVVELSVTKNEASSPSSSSSLLSLSETLAYMEQYSLSMPNAIPSRDLAMKELPDRNGVLYRVNGSQRLHQDLLWRQIVKELPQHNASSDNGNKQAILQRYLSHVRGSLR